MKYYKDHYKISLISDCTIKKYITLFKKLYFIVFYTLT